MTQARFFKAVGILLVLSLFAAAPASARGSRHRQHHAYAHAGHGHHAAYARHHVSYAGYRSAHHGYPLVGAVIVGTAAALIVHGISRKHHDRRRYEGGRSKSYPTHKQSRHHTVKRSW